VPLGFKGDRLEKLIRQKNFLAAQLKQPSRQSELNPRCVHIRNLLY